MKFYSGFSLQREAHFFESFIHKSDYTVCGFSYGAIKAFHFVEERLALEKRVDRLQLFSPAFFQTKEEKFKRAQLMGYAKDKDLYLQKFLKTCFLPYPSKPLFFDESSAKELQELLFFEWELEKLQELLAKGVKLEVYLGGKDAIIDSRSAKAFFLQAATVTYIADANHFLQIN